MPYSQDDIDSLKAAIATGALKVRYADGRETTFRSLKEMEAILGSMVAEVTGKGNSLGDNRVVSGYAGGLSRGAPVGPYNGYPGC